MEYLLRTLSKLGIYIQCAKITDRKERGEMGEPDGMQAGIAIGSRGCRRIGAEILQREVKRLVLRST